MNRFRVLQIGCGSEYGGGSTYLLTLMQAIRDQGSETHFAGTPGLTLAAAEDSGFTVFPVPAMRREIRPWNDFVALLQLIRIIRAGRYDLVHTHTSKGGFLGRLAARATGVPAVHTIHGFAFHNESSRLARLFYTRLEKTAARWSDLLISVNNEDRLEAVNTGIVRSEKIITICNGIDTSPFNRSFDRFKKRRELGIGNEELLVGTVARLAPQKAPLDFVAAALHLLSRRPDTKFIMVGDGPLRNLVETFIRKSRQADRILVCGHRTDVPELLAAMDIFVLTSLWEGMPISILEAMAMAKPVVATDIKGSREVVRDGETGYLVPPRDPVAVGEAVLRMAGRAEAAKVMGGNGRRLVEEVFNARRMTAETINVYLQLLTRRLPQRSIPEVRDPYRRPQV
jgi:glycosyltransferase involved in cell wall biosynthesis